MTETLSLPRGDALLDLLVCAAISPGLRSLVGFDAGEDALRGVAAVLASLLEAATGRPWPLVTLGTSATEERLWGSAGLVSESDGGMARVDYLPGLLGGAPGGSGSALGPTLIVIPDLAALSVPAARACVAVIGAGVAHLERDGQHHTWATEHCWLSGCAQADVGRVSPHLLDRFALRFVAAAPNPDGRVKAVRYWLDAPRNSPGAPRAHVPDEALTRLSAALGRWPAVSTEALETVARGSSLEESVGARREAALARVAYALTRLDGGALTMTTAHVDAAARALRLTRRDDEPSPLPEPGGTADDTPALDETTYDQPPPPEVPRPDLEDRPAPGPDTGGPSLTTVTLAALPEEILAGTTLELAPDAPPYPEDRAVVQREAHPLRLPSSRARASAAAHGPVVGVEPTDRTADLAYVSTILEAVKYRAPRRKALGSTAARDDRLRVTGADLRKNRRAPLPERALIVVMDFTSLRDCHWRPALRPYLAWAYVKRAEITVVRVGAAGATNELQAVAVSASTLLAPRIGLALAGEAGRATPLAHGLELALQAARKALVRSSGEDQAVQLVVLTDGRGNVPLAASRGQPLQGLVRRAGIDNALAVARQIRSLRRIRPVLLNPQPRQHGDLPDVLADAMAAAVVLTDLVKEARPAAAPGKAVRAETGGRP